MQSTNRQAWRFGVISALLCFCGVTTITQAGNDAASKALPSATLAAQTMKAVAETAPVYLRIFKEESELEVWQERADGRYVNIKTFPICKWSGALGPKEKLGDLMAPEGFYAVTAAGLKPDSKYHLALNIGYPNALDRALGRSGDFIMVHGDCKSVGCFAMTDVNIEEIYGFARQAFEAGETSVPVHIFPFRMTKSNMISHAGHAASATWAPLKEAYGDFARSQVPPRIGVCGKRYVVNALAPIDGAATDACPEQVGKLLAPLSPRLAKRLAKVNAPLIADGPKTRTAADIALWNEHRTSLGMTSILGVQVQIGVAAITPYAPPPARANDAELGSLTPLSRP